MREPKELCVDCLLYRIKQREEMIGDGVELFRVPFGFWNARPQITNLCIKAYVWRMAYARRMAYAT
jgi:hypothetical protein